MAIFEKTIRNQNFDTLLRKLEHAIPDSSWSAELEAGSDFKEGSARCSVRVFERYSMVGGNRLSLTLTLFQNGDEPIRLSAIAAGGSTLGNLAMAQVSMNCVDIGLPQLAMHSCYETAGAEDTLSLIKLMQELYSSHFEETAFGTLSISK